MAIEIVFPLKMVIFYSYVKLPEGNQKTGKTKEKTPCARLALSVFVFFLVLS